MHFDQRDNTIGISFALTEVNPADFIGASTNSRSTREFIAFLTILIVCAPRLYRQMHFHRLFVNVAGYFAHSLWRKVIPFAAVGDTRTVLNFRRCLYAFTIALGQCAY